MNDDFDVNKVVADFLNTNIESFFNSTKEVFKGTKEKMQLHLKKTYKEYLCHVADKYSRAKSFFIRDQPTYLYNFYVPLAICSSNRNLGDASFRVISTTARRCIIIGGAGCGKTILMRHLFLDCLSSKLYVPIIMELRSLNQTGKSVKDLINDTFSINNFSMNTTYINKAMAAGHFAFIFDGFDEIYHESRHRIAKEIQWLANVYNKNVFIVSSRPDNEFAGWENFDVLTTKALDLDKACELLAKLPYDSDIKIKFTDDLRGGLFEKHESFLSNPLLLSIMLLTYSQSADIPNKLNVFYNQAYEALFQRHDVLKGGFQRNRLCGLDIQDFGNVFSSFSVLTYDKNHFSFSRTEALDYLDIAKRITSIDFSCSKFLDDALQAVCLLLEDGLELKFTHRSFQEYFASRFILNSKYEIQKTLINKYFKNSPQDNLVALIFEVNPEMLERTLILPRLAELRQTIRYGEISVHESYLQYLKLLYQQFEIELPDKLSAYHRKEAAFQFSELVSFLLVHYGQAFGWTGFELDSLAIDPLCAKYCCENNRVTFPTDELKHDDNFTLDIAGHGAFFSMDIMRLIMNIHDGIIYKHNTIDASIEDILVG